MKMLKKALVVLGVVGFSAATQAALYTSSYGVDTGSPSNCDDCSSGPYSFGVGQSLNFFGTTYTNLFVGSNGYVTFGVGASSYTTAPLNTQSIAPMIAGSYNDLDSRSDAASNVWINASLGQLIITWDQMGHYSQDYSVRSTFQLVVRSDQYAIGAGEGQIGFFYDSVTDGNATSAGFGDGSSLVNPGEVAFLSNSAGTSLSNNAPRWFIMGNTGPTEVPEPTSLALGLVGAGLLAAARRRKNV